MTKLPKTYDPQAAEDQIYQKWEASGFFNPDNLEKASDRYWKAEAFSIAMPPANVTAELHLGSAMFLTIEDVMARHARMTGRKTLWLPGTDHAAIATQNVVERRIWEQEKKTRHDLGREELLRRIEEFVRETRGRIQQQIRKLGASCDWSREKYTLGPELSLAVRQAFKKLYDAGLVYRGQRLVNWCPRCGTTLADDEVVYRPVAGQLYYIRYPLADGKGALTVATTRPETMLGDTALAVHPADPRYRKYVGQAVMLPLLNRKLPVIADEQVERTFGTGVMKVTPGHDPHDFEIKERHHLEIINLFTTSGRIDDREAADNGFEAYAGLTLDEAREKILRDLTDGGFLEKTEPLQHNVGFCYRCDTMVEPLVSKQWFINVNAKFKLQNSQFRKDLGLPAQASLKEIAAAAVGTGRIAIVPKRFTKIYNQWIQNLHDWNISRQIWFGHRVPVWYCGTVDRAPLSEMGFYNSVVPQVFAGKTKTYRLRDHKLLVGDRVNFKNSQTGETFGIGTITNVEPTTVAKINLQDPAHSATYKKREELIARLKFHNPKYEVTLSTPVLIYTYQFQPLVATPGCNETIVAVETPKVCPKCQNPNLTQDPDTLDTWFSSSLWTFSTLGWPRETADLTTYHPTTILETGYDILFFWVARMILMTGFVMEEVPFRTVYLHGLVRDFEGKKMSKSRGNAINPLVMINKYGADALRLSLIVGTTPGNDTKIREAKIETYRNFVNKFWNISRFILGQVRTITLIPNAPEAKTLADEWILSELKALQGAVAKYFATYQYGLAAEALLAFTWNKFADWYLETSKIETNKDHLLLYLLQQLLKLWHPFIPFVTESLWAQFSPELLLVQEYPKPPSAKPAAPAVLKKFEKLQALVTGLRNLRSEYRQPPAATLAAYLEPSKTEQWLKPQAQIVEKLARVKLNFAAVPINKRMPYSLWQGNKVYLIIPHFDAKGEVARAEKDLRAARVREEKLAALLKQSAFLKKAPAVVVTKLKTEFAAARELTGKLQEKINQLQ